MIETEGFLDELFISYFSEAKSLIVERFISLATEMNAHKYFVGLKLDDAMLLYMMIRFFSPLKVFECGSGYGYSSQWILEALKRNGQGHLYSFEILPEAITVAVDLAKRFGFEDISTFIEGDATPSLSCAFGMVGGTENYDAMPDSKKDALRKMLEKVGGADFLFMDGYHNYEFGEWWTSKIIPYVSKGGVTAVHDIVDLDVDSAQRGGDEHIAIREFLGSHPEFKTLLPYKFKHVICKYYSSIEPSIIFFREE